MYQFFLSAVSAFTPVFGLEVEASRTPVMVVELSYEI